jgi:transposase
MIDYEMYCKIHDHLTRQGLSIVQTARALGLHSDTVSKWSRIEQYRRPPQPKRGSRLDPHKGEIVRWLDTHPYSAQQIFQRVREAGFTGGATIVKNYVRQIRPPKHKAFLKLSFAAGEAAQVDWGEFGTIAVGGTRRKLSFFVMVLCHSRMMYLEFTVSQTMEHFLACHEHAFAALGVPEKIMVDNLKSAVLRRLIGVAPVLNPRYVDYARHQGFKIAACNLAAGWEKGRVERGVGYVKKNLLNGLSLPDFSHLNTAAQIWLTEIANVRIHGETHQRPVDLFAQERSHLRAANINPYDLGRGVTTRVSPQFRIAVDTNRYTVPAHFAGRRVTVKLYPDRVCIYLQDALIARHTRSYDRRQDISDPDHEQRLLDQRKSAREQRLLSQFLALCHHAAAYYEGLTARQLDARSHLRKILALAQIYGNEATARALEDALSFNAFSSEYIAHLLQARARSKTEPISPLSLTRRADLLELDLPEPDLSVYEVKIHE